MKKYHSSGTNNSINFAPGAPYIINKLIVKSRLSGGLPATGIYALNIPVNVGGNEYLKNSLMGAANAPPDSLDFTMSMFIAFGGPGKKLQELLVPED